MANRSRVETQGLVCSSALYTEITLRSFRPNSQRQISGATLLESRDISTQREFSPQVAMVFHQLSQPFFRDSKLFGSTLHVPLFIRLKDGWRSEQIVVGAATAGPAPASRCEWVCRSNRCQVLGLSSSLWEPLAYYFRVPAVAFVALRPGPSRVRLRFVAAPPPRPISCCIRP